MFKTAVLALGLAAAAAAAAVSEEDPARMIEEAEIRAAGVMDGAAINDGRPGAEEALNEG